MLSLLSLTIPYVYLYGFIEFLNFVQLLNEEMIKTDIIIIGAGPVGLFTIFAGFYIFFSKHD